MTANIKDPKNRTLFIRPQDVMWYLEHKVLDGHWMDLDYFVKRVTKAVVQGPLCAEQRWALCNHFITKIIKIR